MTKQVPVGVCKRCKGTGEVWEPVVECRECPECCGDGKSGEPGDGREED